MDYKERLERATLMAMQGILANAAFAESNSINLPEASFKQAKAALDYIDSQFANQETQEEQEPKRGQVVWVKIFDNERWIPFHFIKSNKFGITVSKDMEKEIKLPIAEMTTKNPYIDEKAK